MGKREKVLIALMALAIGYGGFELFYSPAARGPEIKDTVEVEAARELARSVNKTLQEADLDQDQQYVLEAASSAWSKNPFYVWPVPEDTREEALPEEEREVMIYSGYLEMGRVRLAVINGLEYQVGEELAGGRFVVTRITPSNVTVQSRKSQLELTIPYEDVILVD